MRKLIQRARKSLELGGDYLDSTLNLALGREVRRPATPAQALSQWLGALGEVPPPRGRILITALRNRTWIEWAGYCACVLRRMGFASTLVYDGPQVRRLYRSGSFLHGLSRIPDLELIDLDQRAGADDGHGSWRPAADAWAPVALAYDLHVEEADIRADLGRHAATMTEQSARTARLAAGLDSLLAERSFHRAFCFSGLIGESKVLLDVLRARNVDTVCLEGWAWRPGHMIYNRNAPALEYNVGGWMRSLGDWDATKEREVDEYLRFLDGGHKDAAWLDNFYRIQRDTLAATLPDPLRRFVAGEAPVFLLAPNVIGDSSTLNRETIFTGQRRWMSEVIRWFGARPHLKLVIRAHPAERWIGAKCAIFLGEFARAEAAGLANVHVIDSAEGTNTFSLIPFARAGLVWLSSAGVDFVVRGLPAVVAAKPKYAGLGIVAEPATREAYFAQLDSWAQRAARPTAAQVTQGKRYLHMVFKGFSFEAAGRNYRATGLRLGAMPNQAEHDRFYRIIAGDEPMPDLVGATGASSC